jgi:Ras-related protein Rab-7A
MKKKFLKVMILGNSGVGKTSILEQYVNKAFTGNYKVTIGADFLTKDLELEGNRIKLQVWDTAGQEKYRGLGIAYYRGADACAFVFDLTDKTSFKDLDKWTEAFLAQIPEDKAKNFPIVVLGNKADKKDRIVTEEMARKWCAAHGSAPYYETSAKTGQGLNEAFEQVAGRAIKRAAEEEMYADSLTPP